jgi:hypothetical protein
MKTLKRNLTTLTTTHTLLANFLAQYTSPLNLWNCPDVLTLLSKDKTHGTAKASTESLYKWPRRRGLEKYHLRQRLQMPFHFIPSCSRFEVVLSPLDWLFSLFNLNVRGNGSVKRLRKKLKIFLLWSPLLWIIFRKSLFPSPLLWII